MTTKTNPVLRENQLEQCRIMFKSDYNQYNSREDVYKMNLQKAYALFWGKCSKEMHNKIEARPVFKSNSVDNLFNLLKAIKEHFTSYQENQYNMSVILDAMKTLLNTKQKEGETLQDYTKRLGLQERSWNLILEGQ